MIGLSLAKGESVQPQLNEWLTKSDLRWAKNTPASLRKYPPHKLQSGNGFQCGSLCLRQAWVRALTVFGEDCELLIHGRNLTVGLKGSQGPYKAHVSHCAQ